MNNTFEKLYGRRKSRQLSKQQKNLYQNILAEFSVNTFPVNEIHIYSKIFLEIGFGMGDHLSKLAINQPDALFIGCEPFINGVASLLVKIDSLSIKNIRIFHGDARILIKEVPSNSLDGIFLLFPDPWPKRKHIQRRFVQDQTITDIHSKLKPNGIWRIATDHEIHKQWITKLFEQNKFKKLFNGQFFVKESRPSEIFWPKTKYEKIANNEVFYLEYIKTPL